ncbi:MAG: SRPBCC domain-containing protein, partial [Bacteroidia bacterium]
WSADMEGGSHIVNDEFTVYFGATSIALKVTELIPGKKIVWYVTDCNKHFLKNKKEWKDTQVIWEISTADNKTKIDLIHEGLIQEIECYEVCQSAWTDYLQGSLFDLITSGKGEPTLIKRNTKVK